MKQLILCFLLIAGFTAQAQELKSFKDANGKYGYKDKSGKIIVQPKYDYASEIFYEGLTGVKQNGKYGFIDKTGKEIIALKYDGASGFLGGLAAVNQNGKYGFIDKTGREIIALKYDHASDFSEGLAAVKQNGKYGFIDKTGKEIIALKYDHASDFSEGLSAVKQNGKWGFIDKTGKEIVAPKYVYIAPFSEGLAVVNIGGTSSVSGAVGGKWGFIDKTGKELIKLQYEDASRFKNTKAKVKLNNREFYIDKTGKEIAAFTTLSPAFYEQFKAILMAKEVHGTSKVLSKDNSGWTRYSSEYKLDGFTVEERISESYGAVTADAKANPQKIDWANVIVKKELSIYSPVNETWNEWMVREISFELEKLKAEGFNLIKDENIFRTKSITVRRKDNNRDVAKLFLNKDNSIEIIFPNKKVGANTNTSQQATNLNPIENNNTSAESWARQGKRQLQENKYDEAIASFTKSIEMEPGNALYYTLRGSAYIINDSPAYKKDFEKAISLDPKSAMPYYIRGSALSYKGKKDEAAADFRKVLEIDPDNKAAKEELEKITGEKVKQ